ncbi:MAG: hypothetical protein WA981_06845 [Glaciecola sp.]
MDLTAIAIVGIIAYSIVSITRAATSNKKSKGSTSALEQEHAQMKQELQKMSERIVVLEKIITDEKYQLNKAFSSLKD